MAEKAAKKSRKPSLPLSAKSPDSDISPGTKAPSKNSEYFGKTGSDAKLEREGTRTGQDSHPRLEVVPSSNTSTAPSTATSASAAGPDGSTDSRRPSYNDSDRGGALSRKSSSASVSFRQPRNPSLPQGLPRKTDNRRLRESSPSPVK